MTILEILAAVRGVFDAAMGARLASEIVVQHPAWSPGKGTEAGRFLLKRDANGGFTYEWKSVPADIEEVEARAELRTDHSFTSLASLAEYLKEEAEASVFVHGEPFQALTAEAMLDEERPEIGSVSIGFARHPAWVRWNKVVGDGTEHEDLSHVELADLLLDNAEDLEDPMLARVLARFRSSRTIEADADLDTGESMGVKVTWSGGAGSNKTAPVQVPRDFSANFPAFAGAWDPGAEPKHAARFRLRVIPPKGDKVDAAPTFRILWVNALDYEREAATAVHAVVREKTPTSIPCFQGTPKVRKLVMP